MGGINAFLNWKTADKQNTKSYAIERSIDGRNYSTVGNVNAANTNGIHHYSFTDNKITALGASVIYYRLKQMDINGKFVYSKIIALSLANKNIVLLYPNPAIKEINLSISVANKSQSQLRIIDILGRVVKQQQLNLIKRSTTLSIALDGLSKGIYYIEIKGEGMNERKRFVKQ